MGFLTVFQVENGFFGGIVQVDFFLFSKVTKYGIYIIVGYCALLIEL